MKLLEYGFSHVQNQLLSRYLTRQVYWILTHSSKFLQAMKFVAGKWIWSIVWARTKYFKHDSLQTTPPPFNKSYTFITNLKKNYSNKNKSCSVVNSQYNSQYWRFTTSTTNQICVCSYQIVDNFNTCNIVVIVTAHIQETDSNMFWF